MNNKQKLTRKIIKAIHGKPWEEAMQDLGLWAYSNGGGKTHILSIGNYSRKFPITISNILQALHNNINKYFVDDRGEILTVSTIINYADDTLTGVFNTTNIIWKLTTDDKQTATLDDQTDETIDKLLELFN